MSQEILVTRKPEGAGAPVKPGFRPEVQGLRALAVLMVVTYHIWFGRVSGGVDIFLLISAFLLTLSFVRKLEAGRPLALGRYWLHMFKRLLPAVVVVLVGILAATALFVPRSRWSEILSQIWSSLFYFQNWALAANSVDYYATDQSVASPLQHFWSLSVQGQVFILWPLLFALAGIIAVAAKLRIRRAVLFVFGTVFLVSLTFSIYETYTNQVHAYFDTRTRLWEFAFGTLLVLALPYLKLPRPVRVAAGWIGLAAMLSGG
ncbi:MAG: acyltransferase, partial [Arthrobacter sp.]